MKGFSNRWKDLPDYIIGVTREIWEDRGIATLHHTYGDDIPVRMPSGISVGNQATINSTLATLAEFPDRELFGEDVIWSGNEQDGFLSSHRLMTTGTHKGYGYFGKPTGKSFAVRAIADCAAKDDVIYDEWLTRDNAALVRQLGMKPKAFARELIAREGGAKNCVRPFTPDQDVDGGYHGRGNDNEWGVRFGEILGAIMNKDITVIRARYDRACQIEHPGGITGHSWADAEWLWMSLRSSFPNAKFSIEHQIGREDAMLSPRAAIRWSLHGSHEGTGMFGRPTGADVYVMGFSHAEFGPYGLRREFTLFDEVSIWKQILMQTG